MMCKGQKGPRFTWCQHHQVKQSERVLNVRNTREMLVNAQLNQTFVFSTVLPNSIGGPELPPSTKSSGFTCPPASFSFSSIPVRPPCGGPKCAAHEARNRAVRSLGEFPAALGVRKGHTRDSEQGEMPT